VPWLLMETYFLDYLLTFLNVCLFAGVVVAFVMALCWFIESDEGWKP
jgi:hypothetical protein